MQINTSLCLHFFHEFDFKKILNILEEDIEVDELDNDIETDELDRIYTEPPEVSVESDQD